MKLWNICSEMWKNDFPNRFTQLKVHCDVFAHLLIRLHAVQTCTESEILQEANMI